MGEGCGGDVQHATATVRYDSNRSLKDRPARRPGHDPPVPPVDVSHPVPGIECRGWRADVADLDEGGDGGGEVGVIGDGAVGVVHVVLRTPPLLASRRHVLVGGDDPVGPHSGDDGGVGGDDAGDDAGGSVVGDGVVALTLQRLPQRLLGVLVGGHGVLVGADLQSAMSLRAWALRALSWALAA